MVVELVEVVVVVADHGGESDDNWGYDSGDDGDVVESGGVKGVGCGSSKQKGRKKHGLTFHLYFSIQTIRVNSQNRRNESLKIKG